MIIRVVKDATLTVKAGQLVEVDERQADLAIKLGYAVAEEQPKEAAPKKTTAKKTTKK